MLKQKVISGVFWNFITQLSSRGIGVLVTIGLSLFLAPDDFGILAMMSVFIAIANSMMDSGFGQGLVRRPSVEQKDLSTAFVANIALGFVAYLLLFLAAPYIARFYTVPALIELIRAAAVVVIINSLSVVQVAVLSRELNFKAQLLASVPASAISGVVAIVMAYAGFGVWSLIAQMIIAALLTTLFLWVRKSWRPSFAFDHATFGELYTFGYKLFLSSLLDTAFKNLSVIVVAKVFAASTAGLYFFAEKIKDLVVSQIVNAIQTVTYPALSAIQNDEEKLKNGYRRVMSVSTFLLFPCVLLLAAISSPLFQLLFPERWWPAAPYLSLMCITALFYPLHAINLNMLKVKGRSDLFLGLEVYKKVVLSLVLYLTYQHGIIAILLGKILQSGLAYIPNSYFSSRLVGYSVAEQLRDIMPALLVSCGVFGPVYVVSTLLEIAPVFEVLILSIAGFTLYIGLSILLGLSAMHVSKELLTNQFKKISNHG